MHLDDSNEAQTCGTSSSMNIQQSDENLSSTGAQYKNCTVNVFQSGSAQSNSGQPTSNHCMVHGLLFTHLECHNLVITRIFLLHM